MARLKSGMEIELVLLSIDGRSARARVLGSSEVLVVQAAGIAAGVPGEVAKFAVRRTWVSDGHQHLQGDIESIRLDVPALQLAPLGLREAGTWDPKTHRFGDTEQLDGTGAVNVSGGALPGWAEELLAAGPRREFEMEQILPNTDAFEPSGDPIVAASDWRAAGDPALGERILMDLLVEELRCLDAHVHLGNWALDENPERALRFYQAAIAIGEQALGCAFGEFDGGLSWDRVDNRPFLRAVHGAGLALWRLERTSEAARVFQRLLWLNPGDHQGARFALAEARSGRRWQGDEAPAIAPAQ